MIREKHYDKRKGALLGGEERTDLRPAEIARDIVKTPSGASNRDLADDYVFMRPYCYDNDN